MSRVERVAAFIREEVSRIIREDVSDPRIGFVSITGVDVSPDLENARIRVSILANTQEKKESMKGLYSATSFIRGKLGELMETRVVPELTFINDDSLEKGSRVLNIISGFKQKDHDRSIKLHQKKNKKR
jgi:ribosome-binding factor A